MRQRIEDVKEVLHQIIAHGDEAIQDKLHQLKSLESFDRIPGDASTRCYYRASFPDKTSWIIMKMEAFVDLGDQLPFLVLQDHLASSKVEVPEIIDRDPALGCLILEDLGDETLLRRLQSVSSPEVERHLYEKVIDSLVNLQFFASPGPNSAKLDAFQLRFDLEKLMWEINFTIEHFYQTYLGRKIRDQDMRVMQSSFTQICEILANQPVVLSHRDFHSRNIMCLGEGNSERMVMIDFQDARLGPAQYDLASLLKDSYYQLEEVQVCRLLDYYTARWEAVTGKRLEREQFREVFDLMSIQRNFKAIGSFASFLNRRGNATYLKYIGNTFENIRKTLLRYPSYSELREVLFHYYYF